MNELTQHIIDRRLSYLSPARLMLMMDTIDRLHVEGVRGDLAEFGIALGGSAICIASRLGADQKFYGFDNFELIPSPEPVDGERPNLRYAVIRSGQSAGIGGDRYYGYEEDRLAVVTRNFAECGLAVDNGRISLIKGLFEDTLPAAMPETIAFAHVDCDWYSPVKLCLETLHPRLAPGATVIVDDYSHWDGCTKATDEFCAVHPDVDLVPARGYAVLIKRSLRD